MKPERRVLGWVQGYDGVWRARGARGIGGFFQITRRHVSDGEVYDIHRTIPEKQQCSYLGSATTLSRAMALGQLRHQQMRTGNDRRQPVIAKKIF